MKSLFQKPHLQKKTNRSVFDISQKRVQHSPFGMLLPCFYKRVPANSYVEIEPESQFICDDIIRPAFIRLKENIDFYAVPVSQLWKPFDNFITGQDNFDSSAVAYYQSQSGSVDDAEIPNQVPTFGQHYLETVLYQLSKMDDIHGFNRTLNALRLLDTLGYGNYYGIAFNDINGWWSSDDTVLLPPESTKFVESLAGYEPTNFFGLLAYQKIYYDYYRNPKYEQCLTSAYNIDDYQVSMHDETDFGSDSPKLNPFIVHYAWAKKDYFTSVQPSILPSSDDIGYSGLSNVAPADVPSLFGVPGSSLGPYVANRQLLTQNDSSYQNNSGESVVSTGSSSPYNVSALRFAFAYDKLLRRMREAGGTFDKQMLAQFGITPFDQRNGKCRYIGGQTNRLAASDVTQVSGDGLGQLGSQINVYSTPRRKFKYTANEDTIIMGVYHTSLDFDYRSTSVIRENLSRYRFDWFNPAFQNLGLQPLYKIELENRRYQDHYYQDNLIDNSADRLKVLGFVRRYSDYKTNIDKVFGLYALDTFNLEKRAWVAPFTSLVRSNDGARFEDPIVPLTRKDLQFNPSQFDPVVNTQYNGRWETDPFNNHLYIHCKLIANMSVDGEEF